VKTKLPYWILLGGLILLSSCASAPSLERLTSDDCLILIPTTVRSDSDAVIGRKYYFILNESDEKLPISTEKLAYVPIFTRHPGLKISRLTSSVSSNFEGSSSNDELFGMNLPYEPGKVVVYSKMVVYTIKKTGANSYTSQINMVKTDDQTKKQTLDLFFSKDEDAASWKNGLPANP